MTTFFRTLSNWTKFGVFVAGMGTGLVGAEAVIASTPATLPLANGARIVIQGVNSYINPAKNYTTETLVAGFVQPVSSKLYATDQPAPHLLAQDPAPTAADVFTVVAIPKPATFPAARFFGPTCQFVVLRGASGKYVCFLDDDTLGAGSVVIDAAQVLLIDQGDPFRVFIAPVTYAQRSLLPTFRWPPVAGAQLIFWRRENVTLWATYPRVKESPPVAGAVRLFLAGGN